MIKQVGQQAGGPAAWRSAGAAKRRPWPLRGLVGAGLLAGLQQRSPPRRHPPPQLWLVALYIIIARSSPPMRVAIAASIAVLTTANFPRRLWESQLKRLAFICALIFVFTAIGGQGARGGGGGGGGGGCREPGARACARSVH